MSAKFIYDTAGAEILESRQKGTRKFLKEFESARIVNCNFVNVSNRQIPKFSKEQMCCVSGKASIGKCCTSRITWKAAVPEVPFLLT